MPLDAASRLIVARDRTDRFRAEADAERLGVEAAARRRSRPGAIEGWEGRPARRPASDRVLALVARGWPARRDRESASR